MLVYEAGGKWKQEELLKEKEVGNLEISATVTHGEWKFLEVKKHTIIQYYKINEHAVSLSWDT